MGAARWAIHCGGWYSQDISISSGDGANEESTDVMEKNGWANMDWDSFAVIIWVFVLLFLIFGFGNTP
jgi:hypothetical protein